MTTRSLRVFDSKNAEKIILCDKVLNTFNHDYGIDRLLQEFGGDVHNLVQLVGGECIRCGCPKDLYIL